MHRYYSLALIIMSLLAGCSPTVTNYRSSYNSDQHFNFRVTPVSNGIATVRYRIPAHFPEPSRTVTARLSCWSGGQWQQVGNDSSVFEEFLEYANSNPAFHVGSASIRINGHGVQCDGNALKFSAPDFTAIPWFLTGPAGVDKSSWPIGSYRGLYSFRAYGSYRYPNLRLEPRYADIHIGINQSRIEASPHGSFMPAGSIVAFEQSGQLHPVFFERRFTPVRYNSSENATVYVKRGGSTGDHWDEMTFNFAEGWIAWELKHEGPSIGR